MAATYRPRKIFKNLKPKMTLHLSTPIYPDMSKSLAERRQLLRDQVYEFLLHHAAEDENVECVRYVKRPDSASPKA
jgi:hypothetical protein